MKRLAIRIALGLLIAIGLAGAGLWAWKPWAPPLQLAEPGDEGERVVAGQFVANYYPGPDEGRNPAILLLGGSEGGLGEAGREIAIALKQEGFAVLQLSYYRAPGQPRQLELVPIEAAFEGLDWLAAQDNIDPDRLALVGVSKGAELGLIVAADRPDLKAAVLAAPSSVTWTGLNWDRGGAGSRPSWTRAGEPMPALPYGPYDYKFGVVSVYSGGLANLDAHPETVIKAEDSAADLLLVCGESDSLWPSCDMARRIVSRAEAAGKSGVTVLAYPDAGHAVFGTPIDPGHPNIDRLAGLGGTTEGNLAAREDSWEKMIEFLKARLAAKQG